jgi:hypothetical protein
MVAVEVEQVGAALAKLLRAAADSATNSIESAAASMSNGVSQLAASEGSQQECSPNTNADSNQHPASSSCCHVAIGASFRTPMFFKMCIFPHAFLPLILIILCSPGQCLLNIPLKTIRKP